MVAVRCRKRFNLFARACGKLVTRPTANLLCSGGGPYDVFAYCLRQELAALLKAITLWLTLPRQHVLVGERIYLLVADGAAADSRNSVVHFAAQVSVRGRLANRFGIVSGSVFNGLSKTSDTPGTHSYSCSPNPRLDLLSQFIRTTIRLWPHFGFYRYGRIAAGSLYLGRERISKAIKQREAVLADPRSIFTCHRLPDNDWTRRTWSHAFTHYSVRNLHVVSAGRACIPFQSREHESDGYCRAAFDRAAHSPVHLRRAKYARAAGRRLVRQSVCSFHQRY